MRDPATLKRTSRAATRRPAGSRLRKGNAMNVRFTRVLSFATMLLFLYAGPVHALCFESNGDGKLLKGKMTVFMTKILDSYETGVPKGAVYAVQEPDGYYFKICDEPAQVNHFMKKWAESAVPGGGWSPVYTTNNKNELADYIKEGVYLIRTDGANWAIWKYAVVDAKPVTASKLYIQTDPADASIRVLNIKPKFSQGMALEPGRYHIEIAARNYQTEKQWIEVKKGEMTRP